MNSSVETSGSPPYSLPLPAGSHTLSGLPSSGALPITKPSDHQAVPWWLWWNILSLDAPMVAVIWQILLGRQSGVPPSMIESAVLALTVWLIYVADHLLDAWPPSISSCVLQQRHLFCFRHRHTIILLMFLVAVAVAGLSIVFLSVVEIKSGLKFATVVLVYFICVHVLRMFAKTSVIKEVAVGFTFAAGVMLPCWSRTGSPSFVFPFIFLALLCTLNCLIIESCEALHLARPAITSVPPRCNAHLSHFAVILSLAALSALLIGGLRQRCALTFLVASFAAALLLLVNSLKSAVSAAAVSVLADVALLLPAALTLALCKK